MSSDVEETIKRIQSQKGVIILNNNGRVTRSTLDDETTAQHSILLLQLIDVKATVKGLDPSNDFTSIRLRTRKSEIFVAPEKDCLIAVIKKPIETEEVDQAYLDEILDELGPIPPPKHFSKEEMESASEKATIRADDGDGLSDASDSDDDSSSKTNNSDSDESYTSDSAPSEANLSKERCKKDKELQNLPEKVNKTNRLNNSDSDDDSSSKTNNSDSDESYTSDSAPSEANLSKERCKKDKELQNLPEKVNKTNRLIDSDDDEDEKEAEEEAESQEGTKQRANEAKEAGQEGKK